MGNEASGCTTLPHRWLNPGADGTMSLHDDHVQRALCLSVCELVHAHVLMVQGCSSWIFPGPKNVRPSNNVLIVSSTLPPSYHVSLPQVWYFITVHLMTATHWPSLMPKGCAWKTLRSSRHRVSCRPPSLMALTTVTLDGCQTRLYGEACIGFFPAASTVTMVTNLSAASFIPPTLPHSSRE